MALGPMAQTARVTLPACVEVDGQMVPVGDAQVDVDIRAVRYETNDDGESVMYVVLDLSLDGE